jgi:hypothetical protein
MDKSMTSDRGIFSCLPNELVNMIVDRIDSIDALLRLKVYYCIILLPTFMCRCVACIGAQQC